jgi:hypothetical protein
VASHDIEDTIAVVDGRPGLADEAKLAPAQLRRFLRTTITRWLEDARFLEAVPGHLPGDSASQARVPIVLERLRSIAGAEAPKRPTAGPRRRRSRRQR